MSIPMQEVSTVQMPSASTSSPATYVRAQTLRRVRHFLAEPTLSVYPDLKGMCERVSDSYRERVVLELLQNAHDAHPATQTNGRIKVLLDPNDGPYGTLSVANDGQGFAAGNFDALCSPTRTTKTVNESIGNKGVGFLSAFQVSAHPEIYSRSSCGSTRFDGYCFHFADDTAIRRFLEAEDLGSHAADVTAKMPRLYLACPIVEVPEAVRRFEQEGFVTVVRLPLKNDDARRSVARQLDQLTGDGPPVHIFLARIKELAVVNMLGSPLSLSRQAQTICVVDNLRLLKVACGTHSFVVAQQTITFNEVVDVIRRDVAAERLPESWLLWEGDAVVSLAVASEGPPLDGRLYNFLPMGPEASAPLNGYLDAPFCSSIDRLRLQVGVELNDLLMKTARALAIEGAKLSKAHLAPKHGRQVAIDLILWSGEGADQVRTDLINAGEALVPTLKFGKPSGWTSLDDARIWKGDHYITSEFASRISYLGFVDPAIGPDRLDALADFASGYASLACSAEERGQVVEAIAHYLGKRGVSVARWDAFYRSLSQLFQNDAEALAGRRLLLTARGEVHSTESGVAQSRKMRSRRRKLSAVFLPPIRGGDQKAKVATELPRAVQRRVAYLAPELEVASDGASPARRFLISAGLIREHETREILRLLATAMLEVGEVKDPEAFRWEALVAMMKIVKADDTSDRVVTELNPLVPTREGWSRANVSYFSGRWAGANSTNLERLFEQAHGISAELDAHARFLLRPYADWDLPAQDRKTWADFLRKAGVVDHLRPVPAITGTAPRAYPSSLPAALVRRAGLPANQTQAWGALMAAQRYLPNPHTDYTASNVYRLPGQLDFDALAPVVGRSYAIEVIRALEAVPNLTTISVYRPQRPYAENRCSWPSSVAAFLQSSAWMPLASGNLAPLESAWLPGLRGQMPPPGLPIIDYEVQNALSRCEEASGQLRGYGLNEYGAPAHAWRFLKVAGELAAADVSPLDGERLLTAAREAWQQADLQKDPPEGLRIIGRRPGAIVAVALDGVEGPSLLVADGDDRQLVSASVRSTPEIVVVEPPAARASEIGSYLATHFPARVRRASELGAVYVSEGRQVVFDSAAPLVEEVLGDALRQIVTLCLRYRNNFYRGSVEVVLERLAAVRLRWLPELSLLMGDTIEPFPRFSERAVLLTSSEGPTLLVSSSLQETGRLLIVIAEALGSALGSQRLLGEPLLAFAAQFGTDPLACNYEDYARVLDVPVEDVRGVLGATRASISNLLRFVRPFAMLFAGEETGRDFVVGAGVSTVEDILRNLRALAEALPVAPEDLVRRCREALDLEAIALGLRVDLATLNAILVALGPPYTPIDLTERHKNTLALFLDRREPLVRESIRATYRPRFERGEDLEKYVAARDAPRPTLPDGFGLRKIELPQSQLAMWLDAWTDGLGVTLIEAAPSGRTAMEGVREANLRYLRDLARAIRVGILCRAQPADPLRVMFGDVAGAEAALTVAATKGGWCDFDRLDEAVSLAWASRSGLWPAGWPKTVAELGITEQEREQVAAADERARASVLTKRRVIEYSGGAFTVGLDSYANLSVSISALVASNTALLETSTRTIGGAAPLLVSNRKNGGGGGGGKVGPRLTDEEREVIGFFGEAIAFDWLKHHFGHKRVVDLSCWKSEYRRHLANERGDDRLGYDFEIRNGGTRWFFEVKATMSEEPRSGQMIELGSSEIAHAESCRADKRMRYRILYVLDALHPERARIFVLPNPRSRQGKVFYAEPLSAGVRLIFPLPSDS